MGRAILENSNGKALLINSENTATLQSYNTEILTMDKKTGKYIFSEDFKTYINKNGYTQTTGKHINLFLSYLL